jgi:aspartate ammonia-lyase
MKRIIMFTLFAATITTLVSCGAGALSFNNKLVAVQSRLTPKFTLFTSKMEALGDSSLSKIVPDAKNLISDLDKSIKEVTELQGPKDGEDFKKAMLKQLEALKKFCNNTIKMADDKLPEAEKLQVATELMGTDAEISKLEDETISAQKEFAKKNNFKLEVKN